MAGPASTAQELGVTTPERVALWLPIAGIGSRAIAYLVDLSLLFFGWVALYFAVSLLGSIEAMVRGLSGLAQALLVFGFFSAQWVYWTAFELFGQGQTPGKRVAGIRVVRLDGAPVGFFESAVRNLLRAMDFLPFLYGVGILCVLLTRDGRRLGDLAAGTVLVRRAQVTLDRYGAGATSELPTSAAALASADLELLLGYLRRAPTLEGPARERLSRQLVERYGAALSAEERAPLLASVPAAEAYLQSLVLEPQHG
jgi:uncharacterized RDD family membrane protein YckC